MVLALIRAAGGCRRLPETVKAGAHARLEPVVSGVPGGCRRGRRIPPGVCRTRAGSYDDAERRALSREDVLQAASLETPPLFLKRRNRILRKWRVGREQDMEKDAFPDTLGRSVCGPARPLPNWCGRCTVPDPPWNLPSAKTPDTETI